MVQHRPPSTAPWLLPKLPGQVCILHKLLHKLGVYNKTPEGRLRDSLHTGLRREMCHTLGEGARRELLTQELPTIPRSALNQQIRDRRNPYSSPALLPTGAGEPPRRDSSSLPIFLPSHPLPAASPPGDKFPLWMLSPEELGKLWL